MEAVIMPPGDVHGPVCAVCSRPIPQGAGLTFMRRDNLIHQTCLVAAQRHAESPRAGALTVDRPDRLEGDGQG
jgi:hypothetical protein